MTTFTLSPGAKNQLKAEMMGQNYIERTGQDPYGDQNGQNQDKVVGFYKNMLKQLKQTVQEERPAIRNYLEHQKNTLDSNRSYQRMKDQQKPLVKPMRQISGSRLSHHMTNDQSIYQKIKERRDSESPNKNAPQKIKDLMRNIRVMQNQAKMI